MKTVFFYTTITLGPTVFGNLRRKENGLLKNTSWELPVDNSPRLFLEKEDAINALALEIYSHGGELEQIKKELKENSGEYSFIDGLTDEIIIHRIETISIDDRYIKELAKSLE